MLTVLLNVYSRPMLVSPLIAAQVWIQDVCSE